MTQGLQTPWRFRGALTLHTGRVAPIAGLALSLALHALAFMLATGHRATPRPPAPRPAQVQQMIELKLLPPAPAKASPARVPAPPAVAPTPPETVAPTPGPRPHPPATMAAPPAPTAEEWAFAARYTLRNSKGYRYTWGQQVRSMMGTAVEGPDQGMVRFRVEIAPDGSLTRLDTLWSTSPVAERLARQAIHGMPSWPPTPTGRPLVFEKTISFSPFASDGPPLYRNDCQPEPTAHRNRFAWDGASEQRITEDPPAEVMDPQALEDCLKQLPKDSIEAESARDQRVMDRWGWSASKAGR